MTTQNQSTVPIDLQDSGRNSDDSPRQKNNFKRKAITTTLLMFPFVIVLLLFLVYISGGNYRVNS